ncbi:MAG: hypothetical protein DHS20C15_06950 [Planctomycetota bacterium]|nr:MAG: hypothetical protein DHS20C15_06950 [Planctomycetota bacterium]
MTFGLRSLAFVAELIHPPVQHEAANLQRLHGQLFGDAGSSYRDFRVVQGGCQLSNATGGLPGSPVSLVNVLADRVQVREEQTGVSREDFEARLVGFATKALEQLSMNMFMVQQFAVRAVLNPHANEDSRAFLLNHVMGLDDDQLGGFENTPNLAGLRLSFPPSADHQGVFNARLESFSQDNRSVFLENVGTFGRPVTLNGDLADQLTTRFGATYDFLQNRLVDFVDRFDVEGF